MNELSNTLVREYEQLEDQHDLLAVQLGRILDANRDMIPGDVVHRMSDGAAPILVWREHRGYTRLELANAAATDEATLSAWEHGQEPTLSVVRRVARALGIDMEELVPWPQG